MEIPISKCLERLNNELDGFMKAVNEFKNKYHHEIRCIDGSVQIADAQGQLRLTAVRLRQLKEWFEKKEQSEFSQHSEFYHE
jgi:hypothetical protein